ncbi:MAG: Stp1/IreP family PP2C-type Ser/Thr phosphatase [Firmicutes bacterium]|nr:Stp1/IreP family PP2C-type Ser/Thr phosphatase [Bacillota bacterium]
MIRGAGYTDIGKLRRENEDDYLVMENEDLFLVCDGVGGQKDGAKASHMAVEAFRRLASAIPPSSAADEAKLKTYFETVLTNINRYIYDAAKSHAGTDGMATTLVLCTFARGNAYVVNLGDSRAYLIRNGRLIQITRDHTYVNQLLAAGTITEEEAKDHPNRNMITKALGAELSVYPDFFTFRTESGDRVVLCSDGMYNEVGPDGILTLSRDNEDPASFAKALVEQANEGGGSDNITVVAINVE